MGSRCHAHVAAGHYTIEQAEQALAADETTRSGRGWRALFPFDPETAAALRNDLNEGVVEWHMPTSDDLEGVFGDAAENWQHIVTGFADIAAVLERGEIWVILGRGDSGAETLVVGMTLD